MLNYKSEIKLSILGLRGAFGAVIQTYLETSKKDYKIITADTSTSAGLSRFKAASPENFIECGISEQSATAIASSISLEGQQVYLGSFSPFIIGRSWEQIRLASYMKANLTIFGFGAGIGLSYLGFTHCSLEDCSLVNSIPNSRIFEPSSPSDIYRALDLSDKFGGINYIRLLGDGPINRKILENYEILDSNSKLFSYNNHRVIICSGYLLSRIFSQFSESINFDVLSINQISGKGVDYSAISCYVENYEEIYCIHESYENLIFNELQKYNNLNHIHNISPSKIFTQPGNYEYVSQNLNFDLSRFI
jgi:transketolase